VFFVPLRLREKSLVFGQLLSLRAIVFFVTGFFAGDFVVFAMIFSPY
jgi:hypothetical protein